VLDLLFLCFQLFHVDNFGFSYCELGDINSVLLPRVGVGRLAGLDKNLCKLASFPSSFPFFLVLLDHAKML